MSQNRFRRIARLELAAGPYIGMKNRIQDEWANTRAKAAGHAAILAFFIRYADPKIGEPLSSAWQRLQDTEVWREYCRKWDEMKIASSQEVSRQYITLVPAPRLVAMVYTVIEHGTASRVAGAFFGKR